MASKYHFPPKKLNILREISDVKVKIGNIQGESASLHTINNTNNQKQLRYYQKDSGVLMMSQKLEKRALIKNNCNKPKNIINV